MQLLIMQLARMVLVICDYRSLFSLGLLLLATPLAVRGQQGTTIVLVKVDLCISGISPITLLYSS